VPHDGTKNTPAYRDIFDLLNICDDQQRGLNCRGLATILNEVYLSCGFSSRIVTCMPQDSNYTDCHVINAVYSESLDKWLWMDPTNEAYVMNEHGDLLGIAEVRDRLKNELPLKINAGANWNKQETVDIDHYLYQYMAKNLYRLKSPIQSKFGLESIQNKEELEYVELLPEDAFVREQSTNLNGVINYTTSSTCFWARPN